MYLCYLSILYLVVCTSEKEMAPHSSTLAWKIPRAEEPGRLQSLGSLRVRHDRTSSVSLFTLMHWRRKWQPTPVFLPGESQGRGSLVGGLYGVAQSRTRLKWLSSSSSALHTHTHTHSLSLTHSLTQTGPRAKLPSNFSLILIHYVFTKTFLTYFLT